MKIINFVWTLFFGTVIVLLLLKIESQLKAVLLQLKNNQKPIPTKKPFFNPKIDDKGIWELVFHNN